ncbi:hypothetical protein X755_30020 [Mesorhizobium sp. LNJC405B00]|nr:hypothetical protein X755_30020 [Mesorhizobium sp. LNJC405B00]
MKGQIIMDWIDATVAATELSISTVTKMRDMLMEKRWWD